MADAETRRRVEEPTLQRSAATESRTQAASGYRVTMSSSDVGNVIVTVTPINEPPREHNQAERGSRRR
jgi:hypothetical protein